MKYDYNSHLQRYAGVVRESAGIVLPYLHEFLPFRSILDVGCGTGIWLAVAEEMGIEDVCGVDGMWIDTQSLECSPEKFHTADLDLPLEINRRFDLAISLEVASDLLPENSGPFVESIARHSDAVLFSSAVRTQSHLPHRNCRWQSFWAGHFEERGFKTFDIIRPHFWTDARIGAHYRQNCLLFARGEPAKTIKAKLVEAELRLGFPLDVVHPEIAPPPPNKRSLNVRAFKLIRRLLGRQ